MEGECEREERREYIHTRTRGWMGQNRRHKEPSPEKEWREREIIPG